jgi:hypothetical protein
MTMPAWLRSVFENAVALWSDGRQLLGVNARLALVETQANLSSLIVTVLIGIVAVILALLAMIFALLTCFYLLQSAGYTPLVASSIVAGGSALLTISLLIWISQRLRAWSLMPVRAINQLEQNLTSLKNGLRDVPPPL